ncbi:rRNA-binding ribosome biosynthesis protein utp25 [Sporothrix curviconia]|uniref:U3 small nucleolar RNA-associated protein 25 n=1 Tax=Sporothrix curviconia TaxID=1260050 RepID=A0ABP0B1B1_9PEZI
MGPGPRSRGRGGPRGGGIRGRGRGRGRGAPRGRGRAIRFDSQRVAAQEDVEDESEEESPSEEEASEIEESEMDSESEKQKEAYRNLMKSFESRSTAGPAAKRRKLEHGAADDMAEGEKDDDEEEEDDKDENEDEEGEEDAEDDEDTEGKDVDYMDEDDYDAEEGFGLDNDDDDEEVDTTDPFETHYSAPDLKDVELRLEAIQADNWATLKSKANDTRQVFTLPQTHAADDFSPPAPVKAPQQLKLKKRLADINAKPFGAVEQTMAPLLFNYYDTLFTERTPQNGEALRRLASLHAVNHVFKTRDRVLKNNDKLARIARKREEAGETGADDDMDDDEDGTYRDQGYNRPKVLILLPTRQSCARMVDAICAVYQPEQQENRKRFDEAYIDKNATIPEDRPADFRDLFDGNDDDMFRLGLKFTRKTIKYFSQFYNSDIILASPLGLRMAMGSEDTLATSLAASKRKGSKPKTDFDFLSSIEVVLMDQADALLMQNWEHVEHIFSHLNLLPRDNHDYDISRLRSWYLDDRAKYYRQTVVLSAVHTPALSELFRRFCHNWAGRVRVQAGEYKGIVGRIGVRGVKQTFSRFDVATVDAEPDARFDYFTKAVVPTMIAKTRGSSGGSTAANRSSGVLVYIPSYLDFVRVRNWFATSVVVANVSFGAISEYASVPEASRAMSHFLTGRHRVLLYSERAHHFRRHQINGVRTVILYGLPENPTFYTEITGGFLARSQRSQRLEPGQGTVRAMFSQYDAFRLERIVGSASVGQMLRERSDTFVFEEDRAF